MTKEKLELSRQDEARSQEQLAEAQEKLAQVEQREREQVAQAQQREREQLAQAQQREREDKQTIVQLLNKLKVENALQQQGLRQKIAANGQRLQQVLQSLQFALSPFTAIYLARVAGIPITQVYSVIFHCHLPGQSSRYSNHSSLLSHLSLPSPRP